MSRTGQDTSSARIPSGSGRGPGRIAGGGAAANHAHRRPRHQAEQYGQADRTRTAVTVSGAIRARSGAVTGIQDKPSDS